MLSVLTVGTVGFTPGKRLLRLRVVAVDGGRLEPAARVVLRTVLLLPRRPGRSSGTATAAACTTGSPAPSRSGSEPSRGRRYA